MRRPGADSRVVLYNIFCEGLGGCLHLCSFSLTVHINMAQGAAYSNTVFSHTVRIELAQEAAYSNTVFHHTANILLAQEADSG